jgi:hypothetical protein
MCTEIRFCNIGESRRECDSWRAANHAAGDKTQQVVQGAREVNDQVRDRGARAGEHQKDASLTGLATRCAANLIERQKQDGSIDFDRLPDVPKPIDKVWLIGWAAIVRSL